VATPDYPPGRAVENSAIFARTGGVYFNDETFESYELQLDRYALKNILKEHGRLDESMTQLLQQARQGLEVSDINAVLLVGGTVQMPAVCDLVQQYFEPEKLGVSAV